MTDKEEYFSEGKEIRVIESESDVPISQGVMLFSPGHAASMKQELPRLFGNEYSTVYEIGKGSKRYVVDFDIDAFKDSKYMQDPRLLETILKISYVQIRNDANQPLGYLQMMKNIPEKADEYKKMYEQTMVRFTHNAGLLRGLLDRVDDAELVTGQNEKYLEDIKKTIDTRFDVPGDKKLE